ncbi:MAG: DEAD/DEAH box helicase, partial [Bacteroidota bacterium]
MRFKDFGIDEKLLDGIEAMGYQEATPIQVQAIPPIIEGKDLIGSAQTGTGKTAAFLLPVIHHIMQKQHDGSIQALVIVPTRELAVQIDQQMEGLSYFTGVSSIAVFGGGDGSGFDREKNALTTGAEVVIGTPGRLIAHLNLGYVKINKLQHLILDEADRMLDMGFYDDLMKIIRYLPTERQNLLFSATMPKKMREMANKILNDPVEVKIAVSKPAERVLQAAFVVYDSQKIELAKYILKAKTVRSIIIFCSTKSSTKRLNRELKALDFSCEDIHSDLEQSKREEVLREFKNRKLNILVATDILSRGIDVEDIDLVINYDVPNDGEDYIHRIGRTARAESKGVAFTFIGEEEQGKFRTIEDLLGAPVAKAKIPEALGAGPEYNPGRKRKGNYRRKGGRKR